MNLEHLRAFLWLNRRLRANRRKRAGMASEIVRTILSVLAVIASTLAFLISLAVGWFALGKASPVVIMMVLDGFVAAFLFVSMGELMSELQRAEVLSIEKFLHLPVSLSGIFIINYLASFFSQSVRLFLPALTGLSIGLVISRGVAMLTLFPMIAALIVMVTALIYQFRGWLATLMQNKRRRRTVISVATLVFVLLTQIPNAVMWMGRPSDSARKAALAETAELERLRASQQIDSAEYDRRADAIARKYGIRPPRSDAERMAEIERTATTVNLLVPPGWLAYGAMKSSLGELLPAFLTTLGLGLIGGLSLTRSYRTTMRLYTGVFNAKVRRKGEATVDTPTERHAGASLLERRLPWVTEQASAITMACLRSLLRAPEAKLILLGPLIFVMVFGSMFMRSHASPPELLRPVAISAVMTLILVFVGQLAGNQFGIDRSGFRAFVLSPVPRRDVLLGKNLALLPFVVGLGSIAAVAVDIAYPMRPDHLLAAWLQLLSIYLLYCIVMNFLSMYSPMTLPAGSMRPARQTAMSVLLHLALLPVLPLVTGLTLVPLGIEYLINLFASGTWIPAQLVLTTLELVLICFIYRGALRLQGNLLQDREQKILEIVTAKVD